MVRNGGVVEAHQVGLHVISESKQRLCILQWDSMTRTWQKIGEVVDAVGNSRKQLYQGKEYDYVFDVDIEDGVPPLKLPYNANGRAMHFVEIRSTS